MLLPLENNGPLGVKENETYYLSKPTPETRAKQLLLMTRLVGYEPVYNQSDLL